MHLICRSQRSCHGVCLVSHHRGDCCHLAKKEAPDAFAARSADGAGGVGVLAPYNGP